MSRSGRHCFKSKAQKRARLKLDADGNDGIGPVGQPEPEGGFTTRAEVADLAAERQEVFAVAACLRHVEFEQVLLLVVDIPAHGAPLALLQQSRQLKKKRGRRLVRQLWPGCFAPIDFLVKCGLGMVDQASVRPVGGCGKFKVRNRASAAAGGIAAAHRIENAAARLRGIDRLAGALQALFGGRREDSEVGAFQWSGSGSKYDFANPTQLAS